MPWVWSSPPRVRAARVLCSAMPNATTTPTAIPWTAAELDTGGFWSAGAPTRLTAAAAGLYTVGVCVLAANAAGAYRISLQLRVGGSTVVAPTGYQAKSDGSNTFGAQPRIAGVPIELAAGGYVETLLSAGTTQDMLDTANAFWIMGPF